MELPEATRADETTDTLDHRILRSPNMFWILFALGLLVRCLLVATSIGTSDVLFKTFWANLIEEHGIIESYSRQDLINARGLTIALFPPLTLVGFKLMLLISNLTGIEYTDVFRLVQSAADVVTMFCVIAIAKRLRPGESASFALFFFLSPVTFFVSAFHCNTDSTMIAFVVAAIAVLPLARGSFFAGVLLAAATGIKIIPLFLLPFFLVSLIRSRKALLFIVGWCLTILAIYLPPAVIAGNAVVHRLFSYSGYPDMWGITGVLLAIRYMLEWSDSPRWFEAASLYFNYGKYLLLGAQGMFLAWTGWLLLRNENADAQEVLSRATAVVFLIALFLAPGFGVQYLLWPIAFLPFATSWRFSISLSAAFSIFLFATYTWWSGGFPWWYADALRAQPTGFLTLLGLVTWLLIGYTLPSAMRSVRQGAIERRRPLLPESA